MERGFNTNAKEAHKMVKIWFKHKNVLPIIYNTATDAIVNSPLLLYVIPYDSKDTLITDNITTYAYYCRLYYKDM